MNVFFVAFILSNEHDCVMTVPRAHNWQSGEGKPVKFCIEKLCIWEKCLRECFETNVNLLKVETILTS